MISGGAYAVTVLTQPSGESCSLGSNRTGTATADVTVAVTCVPIVGGLSITVTATGITSGSLVLQDDAGQQVTLTSTSGSQTFSNTYASGATYMVRVVSVPTGATCAPSNNTTGTINANVTITVACSSGATNDTISVTVTGLTGTLVMQDDKADTLTFTAAGTQTFATLYPSGSTYSVSVKTQPTGQTCLLSGNATGTITANTIVTATCTTSTTNDTISVAVTGLTGTLVMQDDKADTLTFTNSTQAFATSYTSGSTYTVSVKTQPAGQTCLLSGNATGTITTNITVTATCTASGGGLSLSVDVSGLSGTVILQDDQGDSLTFTGSGTQKFATTYASGSTYTVYVTSQPASQSCIPTYSTGTITSNVTISAACATGSTRQMGTVSGVSTISPCAGSISGGVCQQMIVSCPSVPDVLAFVKTNTPSVSSRNRHIQHGHGRQRALRDHLHVRRTAVGDVLAGGYTTVQISWGTPFITSQPAGWVEGTGGVLAAACRYATVTQWISDNIKQNASSSALCDGE